MVKFLLDRPIAVILSFIAMVLIGILSSVKLPVSLMPNIDIPQMTVQITRGQSSAQELEKTVVSELRQQLVRTSGLADIASEARDGSARINLQFDYGTDIDYAFIEVNEKIDAAMRFLPNDMERPNIIKANATDIPVFFISISMKDTLADNKKFLDFCSFSESYIKRQLEQLPEVAMVDMTGLDYPEIFIQPDQEKMNSLGLDQDFIKEILQENNINVGSLLIRDGFYEYNVRFSSSLATVKEVEDIWFKTNGMALQLKDISSIGIRSRESRGAFFEGNNRAVNLAVIKQSQARMGDLKENVSKVIQNIQKEHPEIQLNINRDQTYILDYSISNLQQSLWLGIILCSLAMFLFMKDWLSPMLIIVSVPISLLITMFFFEIFNLSINIISLAGLILAVGNMIDNAIVVIDTIAQERGLGLSLSDSCVNGTHSVILPMITSLLTSCAIFVPLIFLSGISGALFYDQAMSITLGLSASLIVSITLVPVLYYIIHKNKKESRLTEWLQKKNTIDWEGFYDSSFNFFFKFRKVTVVSFSIFLLISLSLFKLIDVQRMPELQIVETMVQIDWRQNIHLDENKRRIMDLIADSKQDIIESNSWVGEQQFVFSPDNSFGFSEGTLYLKASSSKELEKLKLHVKKFIALHHPLASVTFTPIKTLFEQLFSSSEPPLTARVSLNNQAGIPSYDSIYKPIRELQKKYQQQGVWSVEMQEHIVIEPVQELLALYEVNQSVLIEELKRAFNKRTLDVLRSKDQYLPIVVSGREKSIFDIIHTTFIANKQNMNIPVSALISTRKELDYKVLNGGKEGEFLPVNFSNTRNLADESLEDIKRILNSSPQKVDVSFTGSFFSAGELLKEMFFVIFISLMLLYFILAAQFESLTQPLIVLLEIPIDIGAVLLFLYLTGSSLNLMSMIGIVIMTGIIINDSILKIDTINNLRKKGLSVLEAIHEGGRRRLKAILMTALTSILAVIPMFFNNDIGSQIQKPLALAVTVGMIAGTFVSLYFIPLCYYYLNVAKDEK